MSRVQRIESKRQKVADLQWEIAEGREVGLDVSALIVELQQAREDVRFLVLAPQLALVEV